MEAGKQKRWYEFWSDWGLIARLMAAVGFAVVAGGLMQSVLLVVEGARGSSARLEREMNEVLKHLAPLVAEHARTRDYAAIDRVLKTEVLRSEVERLWWVDTDGRMLRAEHPIAPGVAPAQFAKAISISVSDDTSVDVVAGGKRFGKLHGKMSAVPAQDTLWKQFVKQLQIVLATLLLMLQFLWLIFRMNLKTLRNLTAGANRFAQGDHTVRIASDGAPEVQQAAQAFNGMAANTERLVASLAQSESKNRLLATAVAQSGEAIWTTDLNQVVTSWNAGAEATFGYTAAEVVGRVVRLNTDHAAEDARMQRVEKRERFSYETVVMTKAGSPIDVQVAVAPLLDENDQVIGKISVARDVTERNRNEAALRAARAAAESANVAKSAFLARMSHELRTPMNGMVGMADLLMETELTATQRKYAETLQRSGAEMMSIINDVLDFSRIEAGKLTLDSVNFDVRRVIEDVADMLAERAHAKGLELICHIPPGLPVNVIGDPRRVGQILTNLVDNAIKFTDKGSVLIEAASEGETRDQVTLRMSIKDTGPGVAPEAQARIFNEFTHADVAALGQRGGAGMGLAISKQLVELMGGHIHVESVAGQGATFWFTLVLAKQSQRAIPQAEHAHDALSGVRALIVASSVLNRDVLMSQTGSWGMAARHAESPEHALELLRQAAQRGAAFDVMIVDLAQAGGGRMELARAVKGDAEIAAVKILMLVPVGHYAIVEQARAVGIEACVIKPVRQQALQGALVEVVQGRALSGDRRGRGGDAARRAAPAARRGKVLLVEDDQINQAVALGILEKFAGCGVTVAHNGQQALDAFVKERFDLVLMDVDMPVMDGLQATREIRRLEREAAAGAHVAIVAMTANALEQDREACIHAGMDDHLAKPFGTQQMRIMLDRWLPRYGHQGQYGRYTPAAKPTATAVPQQQPDRVLDQTVLSQLRGLKTDAVPDLLPRVLSLYERASPLEMEQIAQALEQGDTAQARRLAHALKASSGNIGAAAMARLCAEFEQAARNGDLALARGIHPKLVQAHGQVMAAVRSEIALLQKP